MEDGRLIPANKKGIIDQKGIFYSLSDIKNSGEFHEEKIKDFFLEVLEESPCILLDGCVNKKYYLYREGIYNYPAILIDFLGYCNYEVYPESNGAIIQVPNEQINGYTLTKMQEETLAMLNERNKDVLIKKKKL